jgi:hypothetical protein
MNSCDGLDLIDELRLRCWARENYRPIDQRTASWHPVILDEMSRRDAEASIFLEPQYPPSLPSHPRRLDSTFGPHEISPYFARALAHEPTQPEEMHYF